MACAVSTNTPGGRPTTRTCERLAASGFETRWSAAEVIGPDATTWYRRLEQMHTVTRINHDVSDVQCSPLIGVQKHTRFCTSDCTYVCSQNSDTVSIVFVAEHKHSLLNYRMFENISVPQSSRLHPCNVQSWQPLSYCEDHMSGKFSLALCWQNLRFYFGKEVWDFRLCCGRFFPTEILAVTSKNFKMVSQRKVKPFRCPTNN
jgi:hypothetical protein